MINKIVVELDLPDHIRLPYLGSVLHGVLMDYLPNETASALHHDYAYSPLKQRVYYNNEKKIWEIISMSDSLFNELIELFSNEDKFYLKHYQTSLKITTFSVEKVDVQILMNKLLDDNSLSRYVRINVITPMSFKNNNSSMIFPDLKKFFRSLMIQFDAFFENYKFYDKETLEFLEQNVSIVDYRLKSTRFHLEKVKIPSFTGKIKFKISGPLPFLQLVHFLLAFGECSGSGIKTSIGMGKYTIMEKRL